MCVGSHLAVYRKFNCLVISLLPVHICTTRVVLAL
jgi:hypothetical protein